MRGLAVIAAMLLASAASAQEVDLGAVRGPVERALAPGETVTASIRLRRGESADISVFQDGVDVLVEVRAPGGRLIDAVDSPNGRRGDEPVSIVAERTGRYMLDIRPLSPGEPAGRIRIILVSRRDRAATAAAAAARRREEEGVAAWFRERSTELRFDRGQLAARDLPPLDRLAAERRWSGSARRPTAAASSATYGSRSSEGWSSGTATG